MIPFQNHVFGFSWGGGDVSRLFSDEKKGWVTIGVKTDKTDLQIYITKTGKVRVFEQNKGELKPTKK